jgi:hypothetical protein
MPPGCRCVRWAPIEMDGPSPPSAARPTDRPDARHDTTEVPRCRLPGGGRWNGKMAEGRHPTPHCSQTGRQPVPSLFLAVGRPLMDEKRLSRPRRAGTLVVEDAGAASSSYCCGAGFLLLSKKGRGAFLLCTRKGLAPGLTDPLSPAGTCRRDNQRIGVSNSLSQGPPLSPLRPQPHSAPVPSCRLASPRRPWHHSRALPVPRSRSQDHRPGLHDGAPLNHPRETSANLQAICGPRRT